MLKIVHTYLTEQGQRVIVLEKFDAERACMWSRLEDKANADKAKADKSKAHIAKVAKAKANQAKLVPSVQLKSLISIMKKARPCMSVARTRLMSNAEGEIPCSSDKK